MSGSFLRRCPLGIVALVTVALVGAACGSEEDRPSTEGPGTTAAATVPDQSSPVGTYSGGYSEFVGFPAYLQLAADGTGRVLSMDGQRPTDGVFAYRVDGDRLVVTGGAAWDCDPDAPGTYTWSRVGSVLELEAIDESCTARAAVMQPAPPPGTPLSWWSMGDVPIVELQPGDDPVTVETPIGTIEWTVVDEQPALSSLARFEGGFAALRSDPASIDPRPAEVVVSSDGRTWTPVPPPPVVPEWLGTRGREVWIASGVVGGARTWPPSIFVTDDNGSSWREVGVDPAPAGVELRATGAAAGPAGVLITTETTNAADGPLLWLLGADSFEPVATPFDAADRRVTAQALDSGFLVLAREYPGGDEQPGSFWTSPDGRTWTEQGEAPRGFRMQGKDGDTVYGITPTTDGSWSAEAVTSFDGGRTWQPAPPRPAGELIAGDMGLVGVAGIGWPVCYGNAFVSPDGAEWARALAPWPSTVMSAPVVSGDTILIRALECATDRPVVWIGTVDGAPPASG